MQQRQQRSNAAAAAATRLHRCEGPQLSCIMFGFRDRLDPEAAQSAPERPMISAGIVSHSLAFKRSNRSICPARAPSARRMFPRGRRHESYAVRGPDNRGLSLAERRGRRPVFVKMDEAGEKRY